MQIRCTLEYYYSISTSVFFLDQLQCFCRNISTECQVVYLLLRFYLEFNSFLNENLEFNSCQLGFLCWHMLPYTFLSFCLAPLLIIMFYSTSKSRMQYFV